MNLLVYTSFIRGIYWWYETEDHEVGKEWRGEVRKMKKLSEHQLGLAVGVFVSLAHAVWALAVFLGLAQLWMDFVLGLHFLDNPFILSAFDPTKALTLVIVTAGVGYVVGFAFAKVWNFVLTKTK